MDKFKILSTLKYHRVEEIESKLHKLSKGWLDVALKDSLTYNWIESNWHASLTEPLNWITQFPSKCCWLVDTEC